MKKGIEEKLAEQTDLVMNIDVQGVAAVRSAAREQSVIGQRLVTVFIMPDSFDELRRRLRERGKDDESEIDRRILSAEKEIEEWTAFDYAFRSESKEADFNAIRSIWQAEKYRVARIS